MRSYYNYDDEPRDTGVRISFGSGWTRAVKALILVTAALYLVELVLIRRFGMESILTTFGMYRANFLKGWVWQPVTSIFVHDPGGLGHLLLNMLGLYFFGGDVDRRLGRLGFLGLYFLSGIVGALLCLSYGDAPSFGASGAVLGVLAAFAVLFPDARILIFFVLPVRARTFAIFYAFISVAGILMGSEGVAHWGHLGGLAVGFLYAMAIPWTNRLRDLWGAKRARWEADRSEAENSELDRILEKVHREGITALSNQERDFLNLMSRRRR